MKFTVRSNVILKKHHTIEMLIALIFFIPILNYYLSQILFSFNIPTFSTYAFAIVYTLSFFSYMFTLLRFPSRVLIPLLVAAILFLIAIFSNNYVITTIFNNTFWTSNFLLFWGNSFSLFILCLVPIDIKFLLRIFYKLGNIVLVLYVISFGVDYYSSFSIFREYMTFSYTAIASIMICFHHSIMQKKHGLLVLCIISSAIIFIGGSRGALLTLFVFFIMYYYFMMQKRKSIGVISFNILILLITSVLLSNIENLLYIINGFLTSYGYNSRNFIRISLGSFLESQGRIEIWNKLIPEISIIGKGLYGDWLVTGVYAHNFALETIIHFGIVLGTFILLSIVFLYVFFAKTKARYNTDFMFVLICTITFTFIKLSLSSSYLISPEFWLFNGIVISLAFSSNISVDEVNGVKYRGG